MNNEHWSEAFEELENPLNIQEQRGEKDNYELRLKVYEQLTFDEIKASKKRFQQSKKQI